MRDLRLEPYITDVLMRDLVRHDRAPSAFLVYLWLWRQTHAQGRSSFGASLQDIARATGLSKSSVQSAVRRLKRRRLLATDAAGPTSAPLYRVHEAWKR
jgi:DNA-binding MarR family transcriptional regulator